MKGSKRGREKGGKREEERDREGQEWMEERKRQMVSDMK